MLSDVPKKCSSTLEGRRTVAMKVFAGPAYPSPTKNIAAMIPFAKVLSLLPFFS